MNTLQRTSIMVGIVVLAVGCAQPPQETTSPNSGTNKDTAVVVASDQTPSPTNHRPDDFSEHEAVTVISTRSDANQVLRSQGLQRMEKRAISQLAYPVAPPIVDRENYAEIDTNGVLSPKSQPVSTFSVDVDTGAYANVRRILNEGRLPPEDAVRIEELVNYFNYDYEGTASTEAPFSLIREIAPAPWNPDNYLLHIGLKGYVPPTAETTAANLVFLLDVSGSMNTPDKLGLLKYSLKQLTKQLDENDRVSIVVYAGASGVVLEPTPGDQHARIASALDRLQAGGSTNGAAGIQLAYSLAEQNFVEDGVNRVILATDGDFNVGTTDIEALKNLVAHKRGQGIALTTLGFGTGNYNDALMEQIADVGNGNYAYIDTPNEARKVLVEELNATMMVIAQDVKVQIEFNPAIVAEYRLVGYENRLLEREDFNNDKVDAGDIGAGHTVTAVYEISLKQGKGRLLDDLRYQTEPDESTLAGELAFLRLRYKKPGSDKSRLLAWPISTKEIIDDEKRTSDDFRFAAAVAAFGQNLRGGQYTREFDYDDILALARSSRGSDEFGYRSEFASMVRLAASMHEERVAVNKSDAD